MNILRKLFYLVLLGFLGVLSLYRKIVLFPIRQIYFPKEDLRHKLISLLTDINQYNEYFRGQFSAFLKRATGLNDQDFFLEYGKLPTFSKGDYLAAGLDILSDSYKNSIEELKLSVDQASPLKIILRFFRVDFLFPMSTGGTSRRPLTIYMNKHHTFIGLLSFFRCWRYMGWDLGDKTLVFYPKNAYCDDALAEFNSISYLTGFHFELYTKIDLDTVRRLVQVVNTFKPKLVVAFPSPLNMAAHLIRKYDLSLRYSPEIIEVSGETFLDCQRSNIQEMFNTKVMDAYGMVELGEIAHEVGILDRRLYVFEDLAYVEALEVESGKKELIVTMLNFDKYPIVRYRTGDIAEIQHQASRDGWDGTWIVNLEGKDTNYVVTANGKKLYPSFFNTLINHVNQQCHDEIIEIKVLQDDKKFMRIYFITKSGLTDELIRKETLEYLRWKLGQNTNFIVEFVDSFDHDYRYKYRAVEHPGIHEYAGGVLR